jgi:hypothetical protein
MEKSEETQKEILERKARTMKIKSERRKNEMKRKSGITLDQKIKYNPSFTENMGDDQ